MDCKVSSTSPNSNFESFDIVRNISGKICTVLGKQFILALIEDALELVLIDKYSNSVEDHWKFFSEKEVPVTGCKFIFGSVSEPPRFIKDLVEGTEVQFDALRYRRPGNYEAFVVWFNAECPSVIVEPLLNSYILYRKQEGVSVKIISLLVDSGDIQFEIDSNPITIQFYKSSTNLSLNGKFEDKWKAETVIGNYSNFLANIYEFRNENIYSEPKYICSSLWLRGDVPVFQPKEPFCYNTLYHFDTNNNSLKNKASGITMHCSHTAKLTIAVDKFKLFFKINNHEQTLTFTLNDISKQKIEPFMKLDNCIDILVYIREEVYWFNKHQKLSWWSVYMTLNDNKHSCPSQVILKNYVNNNILYKDNEDSDGSRNYKGVPQFSELNDTNAKSNSKISKYIAEINVSDVMSLVSYINSLIQFSNSLQKVNISRSVDQKSEMETRKCNPEVLISTILAENVCLIHNSEYSKNAYMRNTLEIRHNNICAFKNYENVDTSNMNHWKDYFENKSIRPIDTQNEWENKEKTCQSDLEFFNNLLKSSSEVNLLKSFYIYDHSFRNDVAINSNETAFPMVLLNHSGTIFKLKGKHFMLTSVSNQMIVLPITLTNSLVQNPSNNIWPTLLWRDGKPVPLAEVQEESQVQYDAVMSHEYRRYQVLLIWSGTKPNFVPFLKINSFILSQVYLEAVVTLVKLKDGNKRLEYFDGEETKICNYYGEYKFELNKTCKGKMIKLIEILHNEINSLYVFSFFTDDLKFDYGLQYIKQDSEELPKFLERSIDCGLYIDVPVLLSQKQEYCTFDFFIKGEEVSVSAIPTKISKALYVPSSNKRGFAHILKLDDPERFTIMFLNLNDGLADESPTYNNGIIPSELTGRLSFFIFDSHETNFCLTKDIFVDNCPIVTMPTEDKGLNLSNNNDELEQDYANKMFSPVPKTFFSSKHMITGKSVVTGFKLNNEKIEIKRPGMENLEIPEYVTATIEKSGKKIKDAVRTSINDCASSVINHNYVAKIVDIERSTIKNSVNVVIEDSDVAKIKNTEKTAIENSANAVIEDSACIKIKNTVRTAIENSANVVNEDGTDKKIKNTERTAIEKSANARISDSAGIKIKNTDRTAIENSANVRITDSAGIKIKNTDRTAIENSPNVGIENSTGTKIKNTERTAIENSANVRITDSAGIKIKNTDRTAIENSGNVVIEDGTGTKIKNTESTEIENSANVVIEDGTGRKIKNTERTAIENSANVGITDNSVTKIENTNKTAIENSANVVIEDGICTKIENIERTAIENSANVVIENGTGKKIKNTERAAIKNSANVRITDSAGIKIKNTDRTAIENSANVGIEDSTGTKIKNTKRTAIDKSANVVIEDGTGKKIKNTERTAIENSANVRITDNSVTKIENAKITTIENSANVGIEDDTGKKINNTEKTAMENSANVGIENSASTKIKNTERTAIEYSANLVIEEGAGTKIKNTDGAAIKNCANVVIEDGAGTKINNTERTVIENSAIAVIEDSADTNMKNTTITANSNGESSAIEKITVAIAKDIYRIANNNCASAVLKDTDSTKSDMNDRTRNNDYSIYTNKNINASTNIGDTERTANHDGASSIFEDSADAEHYDTEGTASCGSAKTATGDSIKIEMDDCAKRIGRINFLMGYCKGNVPEHKMCYEMVIRNYPGKLLSDKKGSVICIVVRSKPVKLYPMQDGCIQFEGKGLMISKIEKPKNIKLDAYYNQISKKYKITALWIGKKMKSVTISENEQHYLDIIGQFLGKQRNGIRLQCIIEGKLINVVTNKPKRIFNEKGLKISDALTIGCPVLVHLKKTLLNRRNIWEVLMMIELTDAVINDLYPPTVANHGQTNLIYTDCDISKLNRKKLQINEISNIWKDLATKHFVIVFGKIVSEDYELVKIKVSHRGKTHTFHVFKNTFLDNSIELLDNNSSEICLLGLPSTHIQSMKILVGWYKRLLVNCYILVDHTHEKITESIFKLKSKTNGNSCYALMNENVLRLANLRDKVSLYYLVQNCLMIYDLDHRVTREILLVTDDWLLVMAGMMVLSEEFEAKINEIKTW